MERKVMNGTCLKLYLNAVVYFRFKPNFSQSQYFGNCDCRCSGDKNQVAIAKFVKKFNYPFKRFFFGNPMSLSPYKHALAMVHPMHNLVFN